MHSLQYRDKCSGAPRACDSVCWRDWHRPILTNEADLTHRENRVGHLTDILGCVEGQSSQKGRVRPTCRAVQLTWLRLEAVDRRVFIGLHVEHGEEARDLQNVVNAF